MHLPISRRFTARRHQRGIATVLIVLLTGTALSAAALGTMYRIRGAQEQSVALHAQTQAQIRAWTGAEMLRRHLDGLRERGELGDFLTTLRSHFETPDPGTGELPAYLALTLRKSDGTDLTGIMARFTRVEPSSDILWASITGISGEDSRAEARATLEVGYGSGATAPEDPVASDPPPCTARPRAGVVFRGDVNYTGGSLNVTNNRGDLANVAIDGKLSISNASMAGLSGCTKDDVTLSGGGIAPGAQFWTEGDLRISNMSQPQGASVWARNIYITQTGQTYGSIRSGAFTANVIDDVSGQSVGTAIAGGTLDGSAIQPNTGDTLIVTLTDGTRFAVPLADAGIDGTGLITPGDSATRLSGSGALPAAFSLEHTGFYGGTLNFSTGTVGTLWGKDVTFSGWAGNYTDLQAFGNVTTYEPRITRLRAGGNYTVRSWNLPQIADGRIGGSYSNTGGNNASVANLSTQVTPNPWRSLPGLPYCDTTTEAVDVDAFRDSANYVFYFDGNAPMLKIQNVLRADTGESVDGTFNLLTEDLRTLTPAGFPLLQCSWQNAHCLRTATPANGWDLTGIYRFPPGILWFDGNVRINGIDPVQGRLYNSLFATGDVTLTNSGNNRILQAPNQAGAGPICGASLYPTNLCNNQGGTPALATWTDSEGNVRTGMPIGNVGLMTEGRLTASGWTIRGSVTLGRNISLSGSTTTIYGTVTVGANQTAVNTISAGGLSVILSGLTDDQLYLPGSCPPSGGGQNPPEDISPSAIRILWSRYQ